MKTTEWAPDEARLRQAEAIVARHMHEIFRRLPMLAGFWLRPDLRIAELSVFDWPGEIADPELCRAVMQSLVELTETHPEAVGLMCGRTFARSVH